MKIYLDVERKNSEGWYKGLPILYRIHFTNGEVLTYPYQWFSKNKGILADMIKYAAHNGGKSIKFRFEKVEKIT